MRGPNISPDLFRQRVNLSRPAYYTRRRQLTFPNHVQEFNVGKRHIGRLEGFEPQHWPHQPLDGPMVLLDDVVDIFDPADINNRLVFGILVFNRCDIGAALVDRDFRRRAVPLDCPA